MENRACHPGNGERQKRTDSAVRKAQKQTYDKTDLVRLNVAEEPPVRTGGRTQRLPEGLLFLRRFCAAHELCAAARRGNSESIALITASVEISLIGKRGRTGANSVTGAPDFPCKISAGLSVGRQ